MRERGSALLAVVIMGGGIVLLSAIVARMVVELAAAHRARADVQCARLAALALADLWPEALHRFDDAAPAARAPRWQVLDGPGDRCRVVARAECGTAQRTAIRGISGASACTPVRPRSRASDPFANLPVAEQYPADVGLHNVRRHRRMRKNDAGTAARRAPALGRPRGRADP